MSRILQIITALAFISHLNFSSAFTQNHPSPHKTTTITRLYENKYPADLDTAYEWIANTHLYQHDGDDDLNSNPIQWFHPQDIVRHSNSFHLEDVVESTTTYREELNTIMPLYPLGMVHVPYYCGNYTLNNIQEKNVNMAKVSF